jgi:polyhydroxyalkanoate synthesis regulator phasin
VRAARRQAGSFLNDLAARLGISVDRLREAIIAAAKDAVQRRVAEGKLTPEQAGRLIERIEQHGVALLPRLLAPQRHERHDARAEVKGLALSQVVRVVADATGLTPRQVLDELRAGKTLAQIGQEHGKSQADLKAALLAALKQRLDEAVSRGRITAEQATRLLDQASQRIDGLLTRSFPRRGP